MSQLARFGKLYLFQSLDSTNDEARRLAVRGEPAVIVAESQTQGRGRLGRSWSSVPGGLYFSMLLFPGPQWSSLKNPVIALLAGVACARTIEAKAGLKPEIAWPNDVLIGDRKVAGILCEGKGRAVIVGCGVNLNQEGFPPDLPEAVSLKQATGRDLEPYGFLSFFLDEFTHLYESTDTGDARAVIGIVKPYLRMLNQRVRAELGFLGLGYRQVQGTAVDLDAFGRLVVRDDKDRLIALNAATVRRIR